MPTTILDGETYEQARHRRFTEEAKVIEKMQQDEIIRMAEQAGWLVIGENIYSPSSVGEDEDLTEEINALVKLAAEHEREACLACYSPDDTATDWADKIRGRNEK